MSVKIFYKHNLFFIILVVFSLWQMSCTNSPERLFKELVLEGQNSFAQREYKKALIFWKDALKIQSTSIEVLKNIAQAHLCLAEFSTAEKTFNQIIKIKPKADDVLLELTKLQLISGNFNEAVKNWKELSVRYPDDPFVIALYGDLLILEGRFSEAESAYKKAIRISANNEILLIKLSACYLSQNKIDLAQQTFEIATANKTESIDVLLQIANYWKLNSNMENAELAIRKATQIEPENLSLQMILAQFYFNTRRYQDSRLIIEKLISQTPENRTFKKYYIKILLAQNELKMIPSLIENYKAEMKNDHEFNLLVGKYYLFIKNPIIAEEYFERVTRDKPDSFMAHYFQGVAYLLGGHVHLAQQSLIKSLSLNPSFSETEIALADIYYKKNELDFSHEHIKRVIAREPENFRAHMILGNVLFAKKQYQDALMWFRSALVINPDSESAVYYMGLVSESLNDKEEALKLYQVLLKKNPLLADVAWRLKELLIETGKIDFARQYFVSSVDRSPKNGYLHYILGEVYLSGGDTAKAINSFNKAVILVPTLASSYIRLARIHGENNNLEKQMDILKSCSKNIPDFLDCYIELGELYIQKDKWDDAIKIFETAFLYHPKSPLLANNLAFLYLEKDHNINKAFELARLAYELLPEDPSVVDTFGWTYYKKKLFSQSINHLENARFLSPKNSIIHYHLGQAQLAAGKNDEGLLSLQQAISLNLPSPYLKIAEKLLEK
jgi:tetratricopeptide (TPR) repeat protein